MLIFPKASEYGKIMPKEAFYKNLTLTTEQRESFVSDIKRIIWQNKLSATTLNLDKGESIEEILVLAIELKKQEPPYKILESISKQNAHKILYILSYEDKRRLALFMGKIYKTQWLNETEVSIDIKGFNMDNVWDGFVEQIALNEECFNTELSISKRLEHQEQKAKLGKEIALLENRARKEKQPSKKFELVEQVQMLKKELERLK